MSLLDKVREGLEKSRAVGFFREETLIDCVKDSIPQHTVAFYVSPKNEGKKIEDHYYHTREPGYWQGTSLGAGHVSAPIWVGPYYKERRGGKIAVFNKPLEEHLNNFMKKIQKSIRRKPRIVTECSFRPTSRGGYFTVGGLCYREIIAKEEINREIDRKVEITDSNLLAALEDTPEKTTEKVERITHYRNVFVFPMPTEKFANEVAEKPTGYLGILRNLDDFMERTNKNARINRMIREKSVSRKYSFPDHIQKWA